MMLTRKMWQNKDLKLWKNIVYRIYLFFLSMKISIDGFISDAFSTARAISIISVGGRLFYKHPNIFIGHHLYSIVEYNASLGHKVPGKFEGSQYIFDAVTRIDFLLAAGTSIVFV